MYENAQKVYLNTDPAAAQGFLNLDGTSIQLTLKPGSREKFWVLAAGLQYSVAIAASAFNTTAPVVALSYDSADAGSPSEKATHTTTLSAAKAVGLEEYFTDFQPFLVDGSKGDALEFSIKTQGAGATVTGAAIPFIVASYNFALDGVA